MTDTIGGMQALAPKAKVDDGLIRVYSLKEINLFNILFHLNKLRRGKFDDFLEMTHFDTDHLDKSDPLPLDIKVYRKALTTLVPKSE